MTEALAALALLPLLAAVGCMAVPPRVVYAVTIAGGGLSLAAAVALALGVANGHPVSTAGGWIGLDSLGAVFLLPTAFLYAATAVYSVGYLPVGRGIPYDAHVRRYAVYLNLFCGTLVIVPLTTDFALLWIALELTTIVSALLVALDRTDASLEAAWKYVLIASAGLGIGLLGLILLYAAGSPALGGDHVPRFVDYLRVARSMNTQAVQLAFLLAAVGFGTKAGFAPLHTWLPDAHSEAPTPVSALLSGALLANALYAILRFYQVARAVGGATFPDRVLVAFGVASLLVAGLFVLRQESYKRLLAYSSIEHIGVIALGVGFGTPLAIYGALFHVLNHATAKGMAFFGAGSILRRYDSKRVDEVSGAITTLPASGPLFLVAGLALCGLPLSGVFRSEFQIVTAGFAEQGYATAAALIVLVNLAFFGVLWHVARMTLTPVRGEAPRRAEASRWMLAATVGCLVLVLGLGVHLPGTLDNLLRHAAAAVSGPGS
ncbi:MAG TPA: proton-conducting transporter membrane subunit [Gaiellales bacterium]|nr:proton-conducting transporter membrane subunit [Gaiellales bacterium]